MQISMNAAEHISTTVSRTVSTPQEATYAIVGKVILCLQTDDPAKVSNQHHCMKT